MLDPTTKKASYFSIQQIADELNVCTKTIRRWIADDKLPAYKLGNQWRIASGDLDIFLKLRRK